MERILIVVVARRSNHDRKRTVCVVSKRDTHDGEGDNKRTATARRNLDESLSKVWTGVDGVQGRLARESDEVIGAISTNASLAAMDIADAAGAPAAAPLLEELEAATLRATSLHGQIRSFSRK